MSDADERQGAAGDDRKRAARAPRNAQGSSSQHSGRHTGARSHKPAGKSGDRRDGQRRYSEHHDAGRRRDGAPRREGDHRDGGPRRDDRRPYGQQRDGERRYDGNRERGPRRDGDRRDGQRRYSDDRNAGTRRDGDRRDGDRPPYRSGGSRAAGGYSHKDAGRPHGAGKPGAGKPGDRPRGEWHKRDGKPGDRPRGDRQRGDWHKGEGGHGARRDGRSGGPRHDDSRYDDRGGARRPSRPPQDERAKRAPEPELPEDLTARDLHPAARNELKTLSKENGDAVARHLAMAGILIDEDPARAHQHALAASRRAGRVAVVRETVAITAYAIGDYALALRELRTYRRISGNDDQIALIVDSERGVGRPERALEEGRGVDRASLPIAVRVQLAIAMSGARLDLGQPDRALIELDIPELDPDRAFEWSPALFLARATVLDELGRTDEAAQWHRRSEVAAQALDTAAGVGEDEIIEVEEIIAEDAAEPQESPEPDAAADAGLERDSAEKDEIVQDDEIVVVDELIEEDGE